MAQDSGILPAEAGASCDHCGDASIVRLGQDKTPLCLKHFDIVMEGLGKALKKVFRWN